MLDLLSSAWDAIASHPHLKVWLTGFWAAYLLLLGGWIVLQKREPVATMSWLLGLALLPYLGFLIYHWFGPQKIRRHRLRRSRSRSAMNAQKIDPDEGEAAELVRLSMATTGLPVTSSAEVRLLVDGAAKYTALLDDIARAEHHVHLEYYIYEPDRTGTALRDALVERARAGVRVRLLLDAVGAARVKAKFLAPLVEAGGEVAWFHPMRFGRIWKRPWTNLRTHRKIVIIDGRIGFTGGMNITDEQDERLRADAYRDLHLRLVGKSVRVLQLVFAEDWAYATGRRDFLAEVERQTPPVDPGPIRTQVVTSGPDSSWEPIHRAHVSAIHGAKQRVWMTTPYFVPGEAAMMALSSAALAGLDVRLLVPEMSDSKLVTYAARSYFGPLLLAGVKIYEYRSRMLHSKSLLVDDTVAMIGSANFDHRSFRLNFEVSVLFDDAGVAGQLAKLIEGEFANAPRVHRGRKRPLLRARMPEALARLCSPLL